MKIGLMKNEYGWERILELEKTSWEITKINDLRKYSLLILNSNDISEENIIKIKNYVINGGALLTDTLSFKKIDSTKKILRVYIKKIYGKGELFRNVNIINIERFCYKFKNSHILYKSKVGKGFVIALPFDLNKLMLDENSKKTYLPSMYSPLKENLSLVSKGDLRRLIVNCFVYLHLVRSLPYLHVWYYPKNYETIFSYRIDLDVCNKNEINNIVNVIKKYNNMKFTWFVSVENCKNHSSELKKLIKLNQDIQSHSDKHIVYSSYEENHKNITEAKNFLSKINNINGFAAPFGHWNQNLGKALEKLSYDYSSEFSLSYDDFPFYPNDCKVIQIPIYPACIGLFRMQLYSVNKMKSYINYLVEKQYKKQMPLFLYDHPNEGIGMYPEVLDFTLNKIKSLDNVLITDMNDFSKFWKKREKIKFEIKDNKIITNNRNDDIYLRIVSPGYKEARIKLKNNIINLEELNYKSIPESKDIKIRNIDILKPKILFSIYYLKILFKGIKRKILG